MDLTALIALTRNLAGDPSYEGNSSAWTDDEIVAALNWAQTRYAELTHCTYKEEPATAATGADGIFTVPAGFILIDRVMIPDQVVSNLTANLVPSMNPATSGVSFSVVCNSVANATFFWSVAGGTFVGQGPSGWGLSTINVTSPLPSGSVVTISCLVTFMGQRVSSSIDVPIA